MTKSSFLPRKLGIFFGSFIFTLCILSVGYAAYTTMTPATSGQSLTATAWNTIVTNIDDLNARWARSGGNLAFTGGNVGIGTANPWQKLDIAGTMRANSYKMKTYSIGGPTAGLFSFSNANVYADTDLTLSVILTSQATVTCNYNITMASWGAGNHLVTRLIFNGVTKTRTITGNTLYWSNAESYTETLSAGTYIIKVQYRTPDGGSNNPSIDDWQNRLLQCYVYGDQ